MMTEAQEANSTMTDAQDSHPQTEPFGAESMGSGASQVQHAGDEMEVDVAADHANDQNHQDNNLQPDSVDGPSHTEFDQSHA